MLPRTQGISSLPLYRVDVLEAGTRSRSGRTACRIDRDIRFSTNHLESYCLAQWQPIVFDALVVTAAVEFCDRVCRRRAQTWGRSIELRVPVHDPDRWNEKKTIESLHDALDFLTGDRWAISFIARKHAVFSPRQIPLDIPSNARAVIPFSEGLDSRAVAGLMDQVWGEGLIRVRLGSKPFNSSREGSPKAHTSDAKQPFTSVPYRVSPRELRFVESSARSRGFKFALVSGLAAYLVKAKVIIVPESGQGALGPSLVTVGQAYEDYRNHPLFTERMERFLVALFDHRIHFEYPQLWKTKGETLTKFVKECIDGKMWKDTWSCWQQNRHASVGGRKRQCGICAACMLRRLSVHAANLTEAKDTYLWSNLSAPTFGAGAVSGFKNTTKALREYSIAGVLHLDHLAAFRHSDANKGALDLAVYQLSRSRALPESQVRSSLDRLLDQHETEWKHFLDSLGDKSFVANWTVRS